jgi:hypothetical protein
MANTVLWTNAGAQTLVDTATIAAATDELTAVGHGLSDLTEVRVQALTGGGAILVEGAPYFVRNSTVDTFQVSASPGGVVMDFTADGGADVYLPVPLYPAKGLRQAFSGLLGRGDVTGGFSARPGVFPQAGANDHVTVTATQWTVIDLVAVVGHAAGPYPVAHEAETGNLVPADGTNPRIDALDLQVQDDDEDASTEKRGRVVYVTGTPAGSPSAPTLTLNSERLAAILVPAGGSPAPSIQTGPRFTATRGGIIPVRNSSSYPAAGGRYPGLTIYNMDTGAVEIFDGSGWVILNPLNTPTVENWQDGDYDFTNTSFGTTFTSGTYASCSVVWTAPLSGQVRISYAGALLRKTTGGGAGNARISPRTRTGSTVGSGTIIEDASFDRNLRTGDTGFDARFDFGKSHILSGLTPGSVYNTQLLHMVSSGTGNTSDRRVSVEPVT